MNAAQAQALNADYVAAALTRLRQIGLPEPETELRFCDRRWRFDLAWVNELVALEIEGGAWTGGRHTRAQGYKADLQKYNHAQLMGWLVLRYVPEDIMSGAFTEDVERALKGRESCRQICSSQSRVCDGRRSRIG